jgi:hypothetical protein
MENYLLRLSKSKILLKIIFVILNKLYPGKIPAFIPEMIAAMPNKQIKRISKSWYVKPEKELERKFKEISDFLAEPIIRNKNLQETSSFMSNLYKDNRATYNEFCSQIHHIKNIIYSATYHIEQINEIIPLKTYDINEVKKLHTTGLGDIYTRKLD